MADRSPAFDCITSSGFHKSSTHGEEWLCISIVCYHIHRHTVLIETGALTFSKCTSLKAYNADEMWSYCRIFAAGYQLLVTVAYQEWSFHCLYIYFEIHAPCGSLIMLHKLLILFCISPPTVTLLCHFVIKF